MAKKAAKKPVKKAKAAPKKKSAKKPAKKAAKAYMADVKKDGELTIQEVAKQEGVSVELVRMWCRDGRIKARMHKQDGAKRGTWFIPKSTFKRPADARANNGRKPGTKNKAKAKAGSKKKAA